MTSKERYKLMPQDELLRRFDNLKLLAERSIALRDMLLNPEKQLASIAEDLPGYAKEMEIILEVVKERLGVK